ncbi:helix-turn-helix domain-containing protein [Paraburkholderia tropica]|uniref:helix-turn-helix domain-containing protein n=1 Tax=Paraburkholderia tropica TaxID=92647 RepID=UPI002AB0DEA5|nr:helix-turn-helix domain-containing protein [Paraburkholderia tropica]
MAEMCTDFENNRANLAQLDPEAAPYVYPGTRAELFDDLAPTIGETLDYRLDRAAKESGSLPPLAAMLANLERRAVKKALEITNGNQTQAAHMLDVPHRSFKRMLAALGL